MLGQYQMSKRFNKQNVIGRRKPQKPSVWLLPALTILINDTWLLQLASVKLK